MTRKAGASSWLTRSVPHYRAGGLCLICAACQRESPVWEFCHIGATLSSVSVIYKLVV